MIAFHIDMNMAQYTGDYLRKWLKTLAELGYDTIIWEVENNIQWETCPECVSPDAFSKDEFKAILDHSIELGLEPIPLFQTIGHCEYVLKHEPYKHLSEAEGSIDQYCPSNPEVMPFLHRWIEEYLAVFGNVRTFHVGADEAWWLGKCDVCKAFAEEYSISKLYINHITKVAQPLLDRGITPAIWADMILHHHEALSDLPKDFLAFDWHYGIYRDRSVIQVWGKGACQKEQIPAEAMERYAKFMFPKGDEPGREPETFYTADFLQAQGLKTVTCPGSSSFGDNVFSPRNALHMQNTLDSMHKGMTAPLSGAVLTSWSVHLFPWEQQLACIAAPTFIKEQPTGKLDDLEGWVEQRYFGVDSGEFMKACGLLSKSCLFTHTASLGFNKSTLPVAADHAANKVNELSPEERERELANSRVRLADYEEALGLFESLTNTVGKGQDLLKIWQLQARNLVNRARASVLLLEGSTDSDAINAVRSEMDTLRQETDQMYASMIKPSRRAEFIHFLYDTVAAGLDSLLAG